MEQKSEYLALLLTFLIASGIAGLILLLNALLGPKGKMTPAKAEPYEAGMPQIHPPTGQFSVKFYLIAMLFILFDVEVVWFFPWAVLLKKLGWPGIFEMFAFIFVLVLAYIYAWKKGALEWEK